jgi:hypothetical protein
MDITVRAFPSADQVFVVWKPDEPIAGCVGFALYRQKRGVSADPSGGSPPGGTSPGTTSGLDVDQMPGPRATWPISPILDFSFADLDVSEGDEVCYQVVPLVGDPENPGTSPPPAPSDAPSDRWSNWVKVTTEAGGPFSLFFNRGIVASQWR